MPFSDSPLNFHFFPAFMKQISFLNLQGYQQVWQFYYIQRRNGYKRLRMSKGNNLRDYKILQTHSCPWTLPSLGVPHRKVGEEPLPLNTSRRKKGLNIFLWKGVHYPSAAQNNDAGMSILWPSETRPRRWHTFTTVSWCFFPKIITNNSCIFIVAAVVISDVLFDTVSQGPFVSGALHVIHMDGSLPFPKIRHAPCSGWAPGNRAFLRMWRVSQSYIWINHNIYSHPSIFLNFHILTLASICAKKLWLSNKKLER